MMVNNSTNITKRTITSYLNSLKTKKKQLEIQVLPWDMHTNVVGFKKKQYTLTVGISERRSNSESRSIVCVITVPCNKSVDI